MLPYAATKRRFYHFWWSQFKPAFFHAAGGAPCYADDGPIGTPQLIVNLLGIHFRRFRALHRRLPNACGLHNSRDDQGDNDNCWTIGRPASEPGKAIDIVKSLVDTRDHDDVRAAFETYLHEHRIKYTSARRRVLDAVLTIQGHFEAEQVLYLLRERGFKVSKATVYRTLPLLIECGILKQVRFDVKQAHYELAFGEAPHDHMVCRRCGRIIEFASDEVIELRTRIAQRHHFHAISHRLQLSGLCWECSIKCPVAAAPMTRDVAG